LGHGEHGGEAPRSGTKNKDKGGRPGGATQRFIVATVRSGFFGGVKDPSKFTTVQLAWCSLQGALRDEKCQIRLKPTGR